ncbi:MAG: DUF433 domain-containing protein [Gemmataceae bacterium]|nr:DUF433 domain-containing protein [Gemmataceae bacterium]MCI0743032.1 DUF433 domain-containing protein [Gemmataceae bacterium]
MTELLVPNEFLNELEAEHRKWLSLFDPQHLRNWETDHADHYESAMAEAGVRQLLQQHNVIAQPNPDLSTARRRPDFLCSASEVNFFVEVACITIEKAIEETGLPHPPRRSTGGFRNLNDAIWSAVKKKADQCGNLPYPALIAVGTFHSYAAQLSFSKSMLDMLLTGEVNWSRRVDTHTSSVGDAQLTTDLRSALFFTPGQSMPIRSSISGLLLCTLGNEQNMMGVLHPNPTHPFPPRILPDVSFCEVRIAKGGNSFSTHWIQIPVVENGRGPQLATSRVTVQDLVPYFQQSSSYQEIMRWIPTLSPEEIAALERYYREHQEELDEEDRLIRARSGQRKNPDWVEQIAAEARADRLAKLAQVRDANAVGDTK